MSWNGIMDRTFMGEVMEVQCIGHWRFTLYDMVPETSAEFYVKLINSLKTSNKCRLILFLSDQGIRCGEIISIVQGCFGGKKLFFPCTLVMG